MSTLPSPAPCPPWCGEGHAPDPYAPDDPYRAHAGAAVVRPALDMEHPAHVELRLVRTDDDAERPGATRVQMGDVELTDEQARDLALSLLEFADRISRAVEIGAPGGAR